jgi:pilus assembly protein Flp/PilA
MCSCLAVHKLNPMDTITQSLNKWCAEESGVTAIEYGLLAALIAVRILGAVSATGTSLGAMYAIRTSAGIAAL